MAKGYISAKDGNYYEGDIQFGDAVSSPDPVNPPGERLRYPHQHQRAGPWHLGHRNSTLNISTYGWIDRRGKDS